MARSCGRCGQQLQALDSVLLGFGPDCAEYLGLTAADLLPQRCDCCVHSQGVLRMLAGLPPLRVRVVRWNGMCGWVDPATGAVYG